MEEYYEKELKKFYDKLYDNVLEKKKKIIYDSILITILKTYKNDCAILIKNSALNTNKINKEVLEKLISEELIRSTDELNTYFISAKGIWEVEIKSNSININKMIEFISDEYFNFYNTLEKPLSSKHKVILFAMIAGRAFSKTSATKLNGNVARDKWQEVLERAAEKLRDTSIIPKNFNTTENLFQKRGNESPVGYLFRHNTDLKEKTKGLYQFNGMREYFLDVSFEEKIFEDKLNYLIKLLLGDTKLSHAEIELLAKFCKEVAHKENIFLFDIKNHLFAKPKYDKIIRDAFLFS